MQIETGKMKVGGISIHIVDISRGLPASGMRIQLYKVDIEGQRHSLLDKLLDKNGMLIDPINRGEGLQKGSYEAIFYADDYYRKESIELADPPFIEHISFRFYLTELERHQHLPLKITPRGISVFRTA